MWWNVASNQHFRFDDTSFGKSLNSKQSFINGVNKPFMGLFFYRDTYMIPVLIVPQILMSTKQKRHRYYLLSHFFLFSKIIPIIWSTKNWCKLVKMSEVFGLYSWMPAKATAGVQDCECGHTLWWSQSAYACGRRFGMGRSKVWII